MGGGYLYKTLNKDVKEINKVFISLFGIGIILIAIFASINLTKNSYALFTDTIKGEKTIEVVVDTLLNKTTVFSYTGSSQEYEVPKDGYYYIEMAGAQGGTKNTYLSLGAKTSGYIYLEKGETLYFYVGKKGTDSDTNCRSTGYEFNGGGIAKPAKAGICGPTGGGATDVRLTGGDWDNTSSLISRIMVAAGAGGMTDLDHYTLGSGGSLYGVTPIYSTYQSNLGNGATQIVGGAAPTKDSLGQSNGTAGSFGKGGYGGASNATNALTGGGAGGGSGYYGGSGASGLSNGTWPGAGGSSYISGYAGVNSVEENTTITHTNQTLHYSGKYFIGGKMLEGQNEGNGYAKITYVGTKPEKKTTKLDNVRYIKNCVNYNTANNANHWIELQAIKDGVNIAKGKSVTGTTSASSSYPYSRITDGDITYSNYASPTSYSTNQCITVDLGDTYDLDEIAVWNYFGDQRRYYDNITSVSSDNQTFTEIIDEASVETSNGHRINAYTDTYNGYISDNLTLWYDGYANTGSTRNMSSTTWKDLSGTGYNGTISGATWNSNYLSFDGVNDTVTTTVAPNTVLSNTKDWTMSAYFKVNNVPKTNTTYGNAGAIFGASYYNGPGIFWYRTTTESNYNIYAGKRAANNIYHTHIMENYPIGTYHYITIVHDFTNKKIKIYDNTAKIFEDVLSPDETYTNISNIGNIGISKAQMLGGSYTQSYIGMNMYKAQIYSKALTEDEILHNYLYDTEKFNLN